MPHKFGLLDKFQYAGAGVRVDPSARPEDFPECARDGCTRAIYPVPRGVNRHPNVPTDLCKFHRDTAIYQTDELTRYRAEVERKRRYREWLQFMLTRDDQVCEAEVMSNG